MIKLNNIYKKFGPHIIFEDYSLFIKEGDFAIITGNSGCGKTTLLNIMSSLEPIDKGEITIDNINISNGKNQLNYLRDRVGFLFQNYGLVENKTVKANLEIVDKKSRSKISIREALSLVNLEDKMEQYVYTLSGGEQQRVALARIMYKKCDIIFADEPTGSLDRDNTIRVMDILKQMNKSGKTIIMVTHDESLLSYGNKIINL